MCSSSYVNSTYCTHIEDTMTTLHKYFFLSDCPGTLVLQYIWNFALLSNSIHEVPNSSC